MPIEEAQAIRQARFAELQARLAALLRDRRSVTLEIGCGHGHFLTAYAQAHPAEFCIGLDVLAERIERAEKKSERAALPNVAWLRAEAELFLEALPADARLAGNIFVLFPDPWPKRRHWKHRLIQPEFLDTLAARAEPGTRLCFRTDYTPYFAEAIATIGAHRDWRLAPEEPWPFERPTVFQSRAAGYQSAVAVRR